MNTIRTTHFIRTGPACKGGTVASMALLGDGESFRVVVLERNRDTIHHRSSETAALACFDAEAGKLTRRGYSAT